MFFELSANEDPRPPGPQTPSFRSTNKSSMNFVPIFDGSLFRHRQYRYRCRCPQQQEENKSIEGVQAHETNYMKCEKNTEGAQAHDTNQMSQNGYR